MKAWWKFDPSVRAPSEFHHSLGTLSEFHPSLGPSSEFQPSASAYLNVILQPVYHLNNLIPLLLWHCSVIPPQHCSGSSEYFFTTRCKHWALAKERQNCHRNILNLLEQLPHASEHLPVHFSEILGNHFPRWLMCLKVQQTRTGRQQTRLRNEPCVRTFHLRGARYRYRHNTETPLTYFITWLK